MSVFLDALMKLSVQFLSKQSPLRNMLDSMAEQSALLQHVFFRSEQRRARPAGRLAGRGDARRTRRHQSLAATEMVNCHHETLLVVAFAVRAQGHDLRA
jgi:hypothetical protein